MSTDSVNSAVNSISRRRFLQSTAGAAGALIIGVHLPEIARAQSATATVFEPNAFVRVAEDNTVTVLVKHLEFGQGPYTGLSTLVAEEMDADWPQMRAEAAPANVELYKNLAFGIQGTGGSTAMANSYEQMRQAGASARAMLVAAAAEMWDVDAAKITVAKGIVSHASGKESRFGALAAKAATLEVPTDVPLKNPADFRLIGTLRPKLDTAAKTDGSALYALDLYLEDMVTVLVRHAPRFGATVAGFDDTMTREVSGVLAVKQIPSGVAIYANNTYAAMKGRDVLKVRWNDEAAETRSSEQMLNEFRSALNEEGSSAETRGDVSTPTSEGSRTFTAEYSFPYLAHAPMETLDGVIHVRDDAVEVWMGSQMQTLDHQTVAGVLGRQPEDVKLHTLMAGGSFGRRAQPVSDFAAELAEVAKASKDGAPIKLMWTREDDIQGGRYRPLTAHRLRGTLDAEGNITHWENKIATQSIMKGSPFEQIIQNGIDPTSVEGSRGLPYTIPNLAVSLKTMESPVPVLWWRSVGHTHTAFATETFVDELLAKAGKDPVEGRLELLVDEPRHKGVLTAVADLADWRGKVPAGRARGVALHKSFNTYVAEIVEVSNNDGQPRVHKVWCAVDCGVAVNPNVIVAQMEGGIGYGLSAALFNEITLKEGGEIAQSNFHDYRSLRISEMPEVHVRIVTSTESPTGVGEPAVPPIAPALANAWRALTGKSVRRLPMKAVQA